MSDHYSIASDIAGLVSDRAYEPDAEARALALAQVHATLAVAEALRDSNDRDKYHAPPLGLTL